MRIRRFEDDRIVFAVFVFGTFDFDFSPRQILYWDQPLTQITTNADNNEDFQEEFISSGTMSVDGSEVASIVFNNYAPERAILANAVQLSTHVMDPRTEQYDGSAGGTRNVSTTFTTNASTTSTQTSQYSWAAGGFSGSGDTNGTIGNHPFDEIQTTYTIDSNLRNTFSADNIDSETITTNDGDGVLNNTNTSRVRYSITGATVYHDSTLTGTSTATFIRPTDVSALDTDSRTFISTDTWIYGPTTQYRTWLITSNGMDAFTESMLGTLDNSGYSLDHDSISTQTSNWRSQDPYTMANISSSPVLGFIVAPSIVDTDTAFTDPGSFDSAYLGITRTDVMLGHTDHQVQYYVYTFTVPANGTLTIDVA